MIRLGEKQELEIVRMKEFGAFLAESPQEETAVLLPIRQVPEGAKPGDRLTVFLYRDSQDRLIATTQEPKLLKGRLGVLKVKDVTGIGAFLDMGLERDLLLPFKEQNHPVRIGEECLVALYVDKSDRLAATMKVYPYLSAQSPYSRDDQVTGRVYEINDRIGVFVAVDDRYFGMIPKAEVYTDYRPGELVEARVLRVREDGKLDLSPRAKAYRQMDTDGEIILEAVDRRGGLLPLGDKSAPEEIREALGLSKNAFKRAAGHLLKSGAISMADDGIRRA